jgi:hypothetical protein
MMRLRLQRSMAVTGVLAAGVIAAVMVGSSEGQAPVRYRAPRSPYGDAPNLNGTWQVFNTANWDLLDHTGHTGSAIPLGAWGAVPPGQGVVEGNTIPYTPAALATKKQNFENRLAKDPEVRCYQPGVPRAMYMPYPFQIIQSKDAIVMAFQYAGAARTIDMQKMPAAPVDTWMGYSGGHWEGDTLVIETKGFNDRTWFDRAGDFHSDALHVVERITPINAGALRYEATIEDSKVFTRPWKISTILYKRLEKDAELLEFNCVEYVEEMMYGDLRKKN